MERSPRVIALAWSGDGVDVRAARQEACVTGGMERRLILFEDPEAGLQVGMSATSSPSTEMKSEWKDELLTVQQGRATVQLGDGGSISLEKGDTAFISAGTGHRWIYHEPFMKSFLWLLDGGSGAPTALKIDPTLELGHSPTPGREVLLTETAPDCKNGILYRRLDGRLTLMLWSTTPYARRPLEHAKHASYPELAHIFPIAGRLWAVGTSFDWRSLPGQNGEHLAPHPKCHDTGLCRTSRKLPIGVN